MLPRLVDTHCHLYMSEFADDAADAIERMKEAGVVRAMLIGCDTPSSLEAISFAQKMSGRGVEFRAAVGIHPHEASQAGETLPGELVSLASTELVSAIGEAGLDYYYDNSPRQKQLDVFRLHIEWARSARMPLILHLRSARDPTEGDAYRDALDLLRSYTPYDTGLVVHCFSGTRADVSAFLDIGAYVSFAGPVTYPSARELREAAALVPTDRILCETDSPYLAPQTHRGRRNEPSYVAETYARIAEIRGVCPDAFAEAVWQNAEALFFKRCDKI